MTTENASPATRSELEQALATLRTRRDALRQEAKDADERIRALEATLSTLFPGEYESDEMFPLDPEEWGTQLAILRSIAEQEASDKPFVGCSYYLKRRMPEVLRLPRGMTQEAEAYATQQALNLLVNEGLVEVYHLPNPRNEEYPTAAIRLTEEGRAELQEETA